MTVSDKSFAEHAKWLAFQRSSFNWPKYWRAVIFKIDKHYDALNGKEVYMVLPRNPEYDAFVSDEDSRGGLSQYKVVDGLIEKVPPMHLEVAYFDSISDVDQWAQVAWRIK